MSSEQLNIPLFGVQPLGCPVSQSPSHPSLKVSPSPGPEPATDDQVATLKRILTERGWMTRKALLAALNDGRHANGWTERTIRNVAEAAGADIVRGPLGFTIFERATNSEIEHAAHISISQGEKMKDYGTALLKRLAQRTT
jgi:hypothetical protein